ncbi:hypothetical protein AB0M36_18585 [Actinoplanes sp. NPDC051346]|uniref:hypothetical protein n=1 Tax=Actinoplanes sp. NPDC051346 TaxID=3155048 RepID=UPI0034220EAF
MPGRDVEDSDEEYLILSWPADPAPQLIIKATDQTGYGMRLSALARPVQTHPDRQPRNSNDKP